MDLNALVEWTKEAQKKDGLRLVVKKDKTGQPDEGDMNIAYNLLGEIRKRAQLRIDFLKKADRYESDIMEYLHSLEARGIICPLTKKPTFTGSSASTTTIPDPFEKAKKELTKK